MASMKGMQDPDVMKYLKQKEKELGGFSASTAIAEVYDIEKELQRMKKLLRNATQKQHDTWIEQVNDLAYRIQDILETYAVEVVSKRERGVLQRFICVLSEGESLRNVRKEIASIQKFMNEAESSIQAEKKQEKKQQLLRQSYAHVFEVFVGMEDEIQEVVSLITNNERDRHPVVSICGMGGLGKTTLAKQIFNHGMVRGSFQAFAWVCITQQCQISEVLQDLLTQILGVSTEEKRSPTLVKKLQEVLQEKKSLIVLDDIWKIEDWEMLRPYFSLLNASSKILMTTRSEEVAKKGFVYELKCLTEGEGWELLWTKTISTTEQKDLEAKSTFETIGKEIVRNCGYLPLAICVIGGILREKNNLTEWKMVNEDINAYLSRGEASNSVQNVLSLSFDELPFYLKPCFLYIGSYREDEVIDVERLYRLWVAESFILSEHCGETKTMVEVAERYLTELSSRCMVEVEMDDTSLVPRLKSCRLHDLMRHFCLTKGKKERFIEVALRNSDSRQENETMADTFSLFDHVPRLCFHIQHHIDDTLMSPGDSITEDTYRRLLEGTYSNLLAQVKDHKLRTLLVQGHDQIHLPDIYRLKKFKVLRVLEFLRCRFKLEREINRLILLRFLSIKDSEVKKLPSSISDFPYIQTLDLRTSCNTYLPNIFWKMRRLQHLYLPRRYEGSEKLQFKEMSELQTLHGFQMSGDEPIDLSGLVNLRYFRGILDIRASSQIIDQIPYWRKIKQIEFEIFGPDLILEESSILLRKVLLSENLNDLEISSPIGNFPPYEVMFCPKLTHLTLIHTRIVEDPMQLLKKLHNLRSLILSDDAFVGKEMVCDYMAFPQLRHLHLCGLTNLEIWRVDEGAMPNLSHLLVLRCQRLRTITDGLNFSGLKEFQILNMPKNFKDKYDTLYNQARNKLD